MAYWSEHEQILTATVAYVGPAGCGKTTSLRALCSTAKHRGEFLAGESTELETDLASGEGRARVRLRVGLEEPTTLDAPDGVVLVLDARREAQKRNGEALRELREHMTRLGLSVGEVPVVVQLNHGDDPTAQTSAQVLGGLGAGSLPCVDSVATRGLGVNEALREVVQRVRTHVREDDERRAWPSSMPVAAGVERQRSGSFLNVNSLVAELPPLAVNDAPGSFGAVPTPPRPNGPPAAAWGGWVATAAAAESARPAGEPVMGSPSSHGAGRTSLRAVSGGGAPGGPTSMTELLQAALERFDAFETTLPAKISSLMNVAARNQDQRLDRLEAMLEEVIGHTRSQGDKVEKLGERLDRFGDEVTAIRTAVESFDEEQIEGGQFRSWTAGRLEDVQAQFVGLSERLRQIGSMLDKLGGRSEEVRGLLEETTAHVGASGMGLTTQLNAISQQVQALDGQLTAFKRGSDEQSASIARAVSSEMGTALEAASEAAARRMVPALVPALAPAIEEASSSAERRLSAALGGMTATMGRLNTKLGGQDATSLGDRLEAIEERIAAIARQYDPRGSRPSLEPEATPIPVARAQMASGMQPTEPRPGTQSPTMPREARPGTQGTLPREVRPPTQGAMPPPLPAGDEMPRVGTKKNWWK